jgi:Double-stranded RNA binding motif
VRLADGSQCEGTGNNKKAAKQAAARLMLDILDGRAKVNEEYQ